MLFKKKKTIYKYILTNVFSLHVYPYCQMLFRRRPSLQSWNTNDLKWTSSSSPPLLTLLLSLHGLLSITSLIVFPLPIAFQMMRPLLRHPNLASKGWVDGLPLALLLHHVFLLTILKYTPTFPLFWNSVDGPKRGHNVIKVNPRTSCNDHPNNPDLGWFQPKTEEKKYERVTQ